MTNIDAPPNTTPRKRRWFQFSLRTLLVLMLMFGCVFAWMGRYVHRAVEQRQAVRAIKEFGGSVKFAQPSTLVQRSEWLRGLFGDEAVLDVNGVDLTISAVGDAGLVQLSGLTKLQELYLGGTQLSDADLAHLRGLTQLHTLDLSGTSRNKSARPLKRPGARWNPLRP